ncbi:NUDIX domain-containing protein [Falsirhodobacter deserti]|uniref:NUDIX domain-containing protein n=1 Tax=Falsirhodobacter deserti TaxID=1365611 RepID=UPI000FE439C7|nr:NUDIX hydrolase [Falsirhodobacter deserti]
MIRRYGEAIRPGQRYRRRAGVYAVCLRDGRVLTTLQEAPTPEIQLPGGGIDAGEHPVAALHREVMEETGWHIAIGPRLGTFRRFVFMPEYDKWAEKVCMIHLARPTLHIGPPTEAGHHALWLPIADALEALASDGDREMLKLAIRR